MKTCNKCHKSKNENEFNKLSCSKDGLNSTCRLCKSEYRKLNKERFNEYNRKWRKNNKDKTKKYIEENKEKLKKQRKEFYIKNKIKILETQREYYEKNKERIKNKVKEWVNNNKEKRREYIKDYSDKNKDKISLRRRRYQRSRLNSDPMYKLKRNLRSRISSVLKKGGYLKNSNTVDILGAEFEIVKKHIEERFEAGMNWDNYGEWHIDHIIPLASADNEDEIIRLCHYTNLQPLWAEENIQKRDDFNMQEKLDYLQREISDAEKRQRNYINENTD